MQPRQVDAAKVHVAARETTASSSRAHSSRRSLQPSDHRRVHGIASLFLATNTLLLGRPHLQSCPRGSDGVRSRLYGIGFYLEYQTGAMRLRARGFYGSDRRSKAEDDAKLEDDASLHVSMIRVYDLVTQWVAHITTNPGEDVVHFFDWLAQRDALEAQESQERTRLIQHHRELARLGGAAYLDSKKLGKQPPKEDSGRTPKAAIAKPAAEASLGDYMRAAPAQARAQKKMPAESEQADRRKDALGTIIKFSRDKNSLERLTYLKEWVEEEFERIRNVCSSSKAASLLDEFGATVMVECFPDDEPDEDHPVWPILEKEGRLVREKMEKKAGKQPVAPTASPRKMKFPPPSDGEETDSPEERVGKNWDTSDKSIPPISTHKRRSKK
ncbi:hypothetical protein VTJ49DRAFT_4074 [Mycothermus thermophilus]|uniref:Uncharacterized protein n=1 Tax=Humicola insolens TaxID=85995 RepID=A0ABR3V692_HUMIN